MNVNLIELDEYIQDHYWLDPDKLYTLATEVADDCEGQPDQLAFPLAWAKRAVELNIKWDTHFAVSFVYSQLDELDNAITFAKKSIQFAKGEAGITKDLSKYLLLLKRRKLAREIRLAIQERR
jgi:hypothetical protein